MTDPTDILADALDGDGFAELRYHKRTSRSLAVEKGMVDQARVSEHTGVGIRVLVDGTWGFASTDKLERRALRRALDAARRAARVSAAGKAERVPDLPAVALARGRFDSAGFDELAAQPLEDRLEFVLRLEQRARAASAAISSATCQYTEVFDEKGVVTSDGAKAWTRLVRPEFRLGVVAQRDGEIQRGAESVGATGGWECLFHKAGAEELADRAAKQAVDLLSARYPEGGRKRVILSPAIVGLLTHEAIGHTVEADFVAAGSCAAGKLGRRVASELVTLCDSGRSEYYDGAGGTLAVDDEGVPTERTVIIENGVLKSYLHDRESAARCGVAPTGNARAWEYSDEPLIRMRNTYIEAGRSSLEEMIAAIDDGFLLDKPANGQADSNGEFMFGVREAYRIKDGKLGPLLRGVNISGTAFEVLQTVDAVGKDFMWDLGAGHCGKGQPAKVDAGGPWLSCTAILGGRT
jgi:TldD protein